MWIATKFGYYSIVQTKGSNQNLFMVRSRSKQDLENLKNEISIFRKRKIKEDFFADYFYRIFINREELYSLMMFIVMNIDYSNFKDEIKANKSQKDKLGYYSEIWGIMFDYQYHKSKDELEKQFDNW